MTEPAGLPPDAVDSPNILPYALGCSVLGIVLLTLRADSPAITAVGVGLVGIPLACVLIFAPRLSFEILFISSLALGSITADQGVSIGFTIYGLDLLILLATIGAIATMTVESHGLRGILSPSVERTLVGLSLLAALSAIFGVMNGNPLAEVLGTLRRMFVYPIVSFAVGLAFLRPGAGTDRLRKMILFAGCLLLAIFVLRLMTGYGYRQESFDAAGDVTRYLSYTETAVVAFAALVALSTRTLTRHPEQRRTMTLAFTMFIVAIIGSNYRTAWLAMLGGVAVTMDCAGPPPA